MRATPFDKLRWGWGSTEKPRWGGAGVLKEKHAWGGGLLILKWVGVVEKIYGRGSKQIKMWKGVGKSVHSYA